LRAFSDPGRTHENYPHVRLPPETVASQPN
jgi:hypothetical protein